MREPSAAILVFLPDSPPRAVSGGVLPATGPSALAHYFRTAGSLGNHTAAAVWVRSASCWSGEGIDVVGGGIVRFRQRMIKSDQEIRLPFPGPLLTTNP